MNGLWDHLPELTPTERQALESVDMTALLGTPEERLKVAQAAAVRYFRERNEARKAARWLFKRVVYMIDSATEWWPWLDEDPAEAPEANL